MKDKDEKKQQKPSKAQQKVEHAHEKQANLYRSTALPGGKGIHIGYTIRQVLGTLKLPTTTLATLLGITQQSAHAMLKKKYLHARLLVRISEVLQHDVVRYLYLPDDLPGNKALKVQVEKLEQENAALKEKVEMLEELSQLLKSKDRFAQR